MYGNPPTRITPPTPRRIRPIGALGLAAAGLLTAALAVVPAAPSSAATADCSTMTTPLYYEINSHSGASLLTVSSAEAASAASQYGYKASTVAPFTVSKVPGDGLAGVHRMFKRGDFVYAFSAGDIADLEQHGYADQGIRFYVATASSTSCHLSAQRFTKNGTHQVSAPTLSAATLTANHWVAETAVFYTAGSGSTSAPGAGSGGSAVPPTYTTPPLTGSGASDTDGVFTVAVLPDTQLEVGKDTRFADRNRWLVANRKSLDLRYATQVGDLVNWDTPTHDQYVHASEAMSVLEKAGVPWSPTIGNHDAAATCVGGAACPGTDVRIGLRNTTTFNSYFPLNRFRALKGSYESGKIDNTYSEFSAEGKTWMMLNLELWPRQGVIDWADQVVKAHPHDNVILVTHSYLSGTSQISQDKEYGSTTPQHLYDTLVSKNPNIKVVLSGHVGTYGARVDSRSGNPVTSFLQCFHDNHDNPTRLLTINTKTGTIRGQVYYQKSNRWLTAADKTYSGMKWLN